MSPSPEPEKPSRPELTAFEAALGSLAPAPARLDRDRVMFQAGRSSARRGSLGRFGWPALAASLAVLAAGEGLALSSRPAVRFVDRVVVVHEAAPAAVPAPAPAIEPEREPERLAGSATEPRHWLFTLNSPSGVPATLRDRLLLGGLDDLPDPPVYRPQTGGRAVSRPLESAAALLRSEVAAILKPGDPS